MAPAPYRPPNASVRDVSPEGPGPFPDWAAVLSGLAINKVLTLFVADELSLFIVWVTGAGTYFEGSTPALILDSLFTYGFELFALWMTLQLCRSRSFRVVSLVAAISWLMTLGDRWLLSDYGWPLWYEIGLLSVAPLALLSLYRLRR